MSNNVAQQKWGSNIAFLMAMIGSAVGLGNIWRFSYVLYSNGGGAFFIPYVCAILIMGIPFLILEYGVGFDFRESFSHILKRIEPHYEFFGWILVLLVFGIACYYTVIVGWDIIYLVESFFKGWGSNPTAFFANYAGGNGSFTQIMWPTLICVLGVWIAIWFISHKDLNAGIGKVSKILIPLLFIIMAIIVIFSFTLPGHMIGVDQLIKPDWNALLDINIWLAAFAQVLFSLSMGIGIAVTYASYLEEGTKLSDNVLCVVAANSSFEIFTAFGVFGILGYMSFLSGTPVPNLVDQGTGLVFIAFPTIFNTMGIAGQIIGPLFFISILFAGITSAFGILEPLSRSLCEEFNWSRNKSITTLVIIGCAISMCFVTGMGSYLVGIVDGFINQFGILLMIVVQCLIFGWAYNVDRVIAIINKHSSFKIGRTWKAIIKYILPVGISILWISGLFDIISGADLVVTSIYAIISIIVIVFASILTKHNKVYINGK